MACIAVNMKVLLSIRSLLTHPNPEALKQGILGHVIVEDPLVPEIAQVLMYNILRAHSCFHNFFNIILQILKTNRPEHDKTAAEWTRKYAV